MASEASRIQPEGVAGDPILLQVHEVYRSIPIYHLSFLRPVAYDEATHAAELTAVGSIPESRFALAINCENLSLAGVFPADAQAATHLSPVLHVLRQRAVAVARYNPDSLTSMVRTMALHIYGRRGISSGFEADFEAALRSLRREIDLLTQRESAGQATPTPALQS